MFNVKPKSEVAKADWQDTCIVQEGAASRSDFNGFDQIVDLPNGHRVHILERRGFDSAIQHAMAEFLKG